MSEIAIVDLQKISLKIHSPKLEDYMHVSREIKKCFENIGFMYIMNHGIPQEVIDRGMRSSMEFFDLEREVKNLTRKGSEYQGWVEQGRETFDQDEQGNIAELEVRETYDLKNVSSSGIFPDEVSAVRYLHNNARWNGNKHDKNSCISSELSPTERVPDASLRVQQGSRPEAATLHLPQP